MERYTALLEATPYSWFTILVLALGGVVALATVPAKRRRYPALFRRRRSLGTLVLLTLSALSLLAAIFVPGPERLPPIVTIYPYLIGGLLLSTLLFRFPRTALPLGAIAITLFLWAEQRATEIYYFAEEGSPLLYVEVQQVEGEELRSFVEIPPDIADRLLATGADPTFASTFQGELLLTGEYLLPHPYLWWRHPRLGVRLTALGADAGEHPAFSTLDEWPRQALALFIQGGVYTFLEWEVRRPVGEVLLARYGLTISSGDPPETRLQRESVD